MKIEG